MLPVVVLNDAVTAPELGAGATAIVFVTPVEGTGEVPAALLA